MKKTIPKPNGFITTIFSINGLRRFLWSDLDSWLQPQTDKEDQQKKTNRDLVYGAKFTVLIQNSLLSGLKYEKF